MSPAPVLVVDDDGATRQMLRRILQAEGSTVDPATDGEEALLAIEQRSPAVVLLDLRMPRMDGWRFDREVQARGLRLPLVVMTAALDEESQRWADEVQAVAYLAKPFGIEELLQAVAPWACGSLPGAAPAR